jgi:hypothetical protein
MVDKLVNDDPGLLLGNNLDQVDTFTATGSATYLRGTILGRKTADLKLFVYDDGAIDGTEVPVGILHNDLVTTGAGDVTIRMGISGMYREEQVTVYDGGVPRVVDVAEKDLLRRMDLLLEPSVEQYVEDN